MNHQSVVVHRDHIREVQVVVVQQAVTRQRQHHLIPVQCQVVLVRLSHTVHRPLIIIIIIETSRATVQEKPQRVIHIINVIGETSKRHSQASQFQIPLTNQQAPPPHYHHQAV